MRRESWLALRKRMPAAGEDPPSSSDRVVLADVHGKEDAADTEFATDWDDLSGVEVVAGEFVTVTSDTRADSPYGAIGKLLQQVRARTGMDVVFISQFVDGMRLVRHVAADPRDPHAVVPGAVDPLEATYCQRVLDGRLPGSLVDARGNPEAAGLRLTEALKVRAHVAAPVLTGDGRVFGTVCAYAHHPQREVEHALGVVRAVAGALSKVLDRAEQR
jgi:hypothetical protein